MNVPNKSRAGFTLLEVLMASVILAIALMGLLSAILYIHRLNQGARENEIALRGAQEAMEEVMSEDLSTVVATWNGGVFDVSGISAQDGDADGRVGSVSVDDTNPDLLIVQIRVDWRGVTGNNSIRLDSMMARRE